ncbi:phage tail protein [Lactococcus cremoris]|uniref:phage tail protein n=1 Tax=Lactococcus lactis subsp. cremoris TaxID=1359 RepID=UPI002FC77C1B
MLINVLDVNLQKVAFLSNDVPGLPNYYDDEFHEYRDQGAATFKFTVKKVINNKLQSYARFLNGQSYFSFQIDGNDYLMTPASEQAIHETSEEISFFCVSLDRELMSEQANPLVNTSSHNIQWYFDQMALISNTQITIGNNEVSNLTRTINYDGQETKLARLISVIGNFDAEFEFITKLNNDGSLGSVTLNIYKENDGLDIQGVGKKRDDVRLIFGENIQTVERDVSTEGFLNATTVTGADNLNWNSASFSYINADGVEEFYKRAGSDTAFAPLSAKIYPAQLSKDKDDIWTRIDFTTEYKNVNDMWAYAVRQFKQYAYHQVSYTVTPSSKLVNAEIGDGPPLGKGDTVIIQDNNYIDINGNVGLLLSARVSEKIVSETHPENNKLIFSNYKKLKNEVSTDIQAIVNQLVEAATPYRAELTTTNGTQFKNGTGSTTLSAHIYKGSATAETIADSYSWTKDGTVVAPTQTITVDASGVSDKAVYSFKATVGGKVVASQSVTITNVNDGIAGKDGTGIKTTTITYAGSTSGTMAPTIGWTSTVPTVAAGSYLWTKTVWTYTDNTSETGYSVAMMGVKGDKGDQGVQGIQGVDGRQGIPGPKGADGKTQYTHIAYANSADGKTDFSTSDSNRTYIGMYVDFNINDSNTPSDYSWTLVKGADGTQGTPGKPGTDGKTPYFHTAWSHSADGTNGFTTVYPNLNLLDGTRDFKPRGAGNGTANQNTGEIYFTQNKTVADLFKAGDYITISYDIEFLNTELYSSSEDVNITIQMYGGSYTWISRINAKNVGGKFYTNDSFKSSGYVETPTHKVTVSRIIQLTQDFINANATVNSIGLVYNFIPVGANTNLTNLKIEPEKDLNSTATSWMPSSSEATTADWPSYIGQYTDFTQADNTNPSAYTWSLIRGNDGATGPQGPAGSNGDPGKIVSDTEPSTRFQRIDLEILRRL